MTGWALALLTMSWLVLPSIGGRAARATRGGRAQPEIHGFLRVLDVLNKLYCLAWHQLSLDDSARPARVGPRDSHFESYMWNRSHVASSQESAAARLHGGARVL